MKNMINTILGVIMVVAGFALAIYTGLWLFFIRGMIDVLDQVKIVIDGGEFESLRIAIGVVKMMSASFVGYVCGVVFVTPGLILISH